MRAYVCLLQIVFTLEFVEATSCCFSCESTQFVAGKTCRFVTASAVKWSTVTRHNWFISLRSTVFPCVFTLHHTAAVACCFLWFCESTVSSGFGCLSAHILRIQKMPCSLAASINRRYISKKNWEKKDYDANNKIYEGAKSSNEVFSIINSFCVFILRQ